MRPRSSTYARSAMSSAVGRILLDQQDGHAVAGQSVDHVEDGFDQERSKAHGGFIKEQEHRVRHQGSTHRDHLLFAAGQCSGTLLPALRKAREGRVDPVHGRVWDHAMSAGECSNSDVFFHTHRREDAASFGDHRDPRPNNSSRIATSDVFTCENN